MHDPDSFEKLLCDRSCIILGQRALDIHIQSSALEVLHGNVDMLIIIEPTQKYDKRLRLNKLQAVSPSIHFINFTQY
jgi:hypothetical protein